MVPITNIFTQPFTPLHLLPVDGGTRIGSSEEYGRSAFGGVPQYIDPNGAKLGQGNRELPKAYDSDFRKEVGGVVPGYTGFVPDKHSKYGESHWGQVSGTSQGKVTPPAASLLARACAHLRRLRRYTALGDSSPAAEPLCAQALPFALPGIEPRSQSPCARTIFLV